ncbi:MAG: response regulator, partial [Chloroflexi bacterium]|jgi:YesN/AraC family two-component response regulator|nr:response regulator [Chloroflexota bacterium]
MAGTLIADDTPLIRSALRNILTRSAMDVEPIFEACDGEDAVRQARRCHPDIVLLDIKMPGMDGLEAASIIRDEFPRTKVVMLTAYDEFSYVYKALKLGVEDYLLKPVRPEKLVEVLEGLQAKEQRRREEEWARAAQRPPRRAAVPPQELPITPLPEADPVQQALTYIDDNYCNPDISLTEVAGAACLSPSHLSALFKAETGMTYIHYLTTLRMKRAQELLRSTTQSVASVARAVGYRHTTNFYRHFQREVGMTPAAYREAQL